MAHAYAIAYALRSGGPIRVLFLRAIMAVNPILGSRTEPEQLTAAADLPHPHSRPESYSDEQSGAEQAVPSSVCWYGGALERAFVSERTCIANPTTSALKWCFIQTHPSWAPPQRVCSGELGVRAAASDLAALALCLPRSGMER